MTRTHRRAETAIALALLFVAPPLCVALLASLAWVVVTWPWHGAALFVFGFALYLVQVRLNAKETK